MGTTSGLGFRVYFWRVILKLKGVGLCGFGVVDFVFSALPLEILTIFSMGVDQRFLTLKGDPGNVHKPQ